MKTIWYIIIAVAVAGVVYGGLRTNWFGRATGGGAGPTPDDHAGVARAEDDHAGHDPSSDLSGALKVVDASEGVPRLKRAPSVTCATPQKIVQFANAEIADRAGLQVARVERRPVSHSIECNAELAFNGDRFAHISSRAPGTVVRANVRAGERVDEGQVLAIVDSAELGAARAEHLQAVALVNLWQKNHSRQVELNENGINANRTLLEAQTSLAEAQITLSRTAQRLRNLGLTDEQIEQGGQSNDTSSSLPIIAPFAGLIVDRHAVQGEVVDTQTPLFELADMSTMWAMLDIHESSVRHVKPGQPVVVQVQGMEGQQVGGKITWLAGSVDPVTRTLKGRADIANDEGLLRANMFGRATIIVSDARQAIVVPKSAVQWEGCCNVVFVKHTPTVFQPYKVRLGFDAGDYIVVEEGLEPGENIVTQGAFLLKTEILKGSIGAGCCEVHGVTDAKK